MSLQQTLYQTETPLSRAFFSSSNFNIIQNRIRGDFRAKTGISIDYQKPQDVMALMRNVYVMGDPFNGNIQRMNDTVIQMAIKQIGTNIKQYIYYINDLKNPNKIAPRPVNTSTYGFASGTVDLRLKRS